MVECVGRHWDYRFCHSRCHIRSKFKSPSKCRCSRCNAYRNRWRNLSRSFITKTSNSSWRKYLWTMDFLNRFGDRFKMGDYECRIDYCIYYFYFFTLAHLLQPMENSLPQFLKLLKETLNSNSLIDNVKCRCYHYLEVEI